MQIIRTAFDADVSLASAASRILVAAGLPARCPFIKRNADGSVTFEWWLTAPCGDDYGLDCGRVVVTFFTRKSTAWEWESRVLRKHWLGLHGPYSDVLTPASVRDVPRQRCASNDPPTEFVAFVRVNRELLYDAVEQRKRAERRAKAKRRGP